MSAGHFPLVLAQAMRAGATRWHAMPPAWVLWLVVVPLAIAVGWWAYRRDRELAAGPRLLLGALRSAAIVFLLLVLFGPFRETSEKREVRSHLLFLLDTSASMATVDGYDPDESTRKLAEAAGVDVSEVGKLSRLDLARRVLANPRHGLLERLTKDFRVHVYGFGSGLVPIVSTGDTADDEPGAEAAAPGQRIRSTLSRLQPTDPSTRLGQAVSLALDEYRNRDEDVAGVVVVSDGRQTAGTVTPLAAGRKANAQHVPVFAVGVGDPKSPNNIHVSNLRAKEVVLARDTAVFEFEVLAKGFENRTVPIEVRALDDSGEPRGSPLAVSPGEVLLQGGDQPQQVRVTYRFDRADTYALRIGIPVQDGEKIKSDNFVFHTVRVIDRKMKVLFVDSLPRYEFYYLSQSLTRDRETMLAHTLLLDADPETPQRRTIAPDWPPLENTRAMPPRDKLFDYDVIILGDVNWEQFAASRADAEAACANLRDFVDRGGGLIFIAGPESMPSKYRDTDLAGAIPVVIDREAEHEYANLEHDTVQGFSLRLTPEGLQSPLMNVAGDPEESKRLWETTPQWRQYWSYPALRAKAVAKVLAVSTEPGSENKFGPRPLIVTMPYGRGRTLFIGLDDLWRLRFEAGDRYFYRFYGEAVRFLATYRLLGGNKRFKIMTDLETYTLDDPVHITLDVLDREYMPSRAATQRVKLDMPGAEPGRREQVDLTVAADPGEPGEYRKTIVPTRPGDYRLSATTDDPNDEPPEKLFHVVASTVETRDLLLDEQSLRDLAAASDHGQYLYLCDLPEIAPRPLTKSISSDVREDEMWDNGWTLAVAVALLGAEWALRKRWRLV